VPAPSLASPTSSGPDEKKREEVAFWGCCCCCCCYCCCCARLRTVRSCVRASGADRVSWREWEGREREKEHRAHSARSRHRRTAETQRQHARRTHHTHQPDRQPDRPSREQTADRNASCRLSLNAALVARNPQVALGFCAQPTLKLSLSGQCFSCFLLVVDLPLPILTKQMTEVSKRAPPPPQALSEPLLTSHWGL